MRTVELKLSAGSLKASWLLAPGASKSADRIAVLVIANVPDDVTDAAAAMLANKTIINVPSHTKEPAKVEYGRLGAGKWVNLVIGRPEGSGVKPPEERKRARSVSLNDAQAEELTRLGGSAWLQEQLNASLKRRP